MTQNGLGPHGEDGRHPAPFAGNDAMTDGIDAAVQAVQPTLLDSMLDSAPANAHSVELRAGDDAMLTLRERRDPSVNARLSLTVHYRVNRNLVGHRRMVARKV